MSSTAMKTEGGGCALSDETINIIKAITPAVAPRAVDITSNFYKRMFNANPEVKKYFNQAHQVSGDQPRALAGSVCAYFSNIDNLGALTPAVELIAQKHVSLMVQPEHYPIVGTNLLASIKEVMGDAATPEVMNAVKEAYGLLAQICINREAELYKAQASIPNGWTGYRTFVVDKKVPENDTVTSFYLKPKDGKGIPTWSAGQYITLQINNHPTEDIVAPRNYSLSDAPSSERGKDKECFRISVKREAPRASGCPLGIVSNHLIDNVKQGDEVSVGPPCGEFVVRQDKTTASKETVLLAGGIGATPLIAISKAVSRMDPTAPITFIHSVQNAKAQLLTNELKEFPNIKLKLVFTQPDASDKNVPFDHTGRINADYIKSLIPSPNEAQYYFCGPEPFLINIKKCLDTLKVEQQNQHYEFFKPLQSVEAAS